jgi:hypothetical protein
MSVTYGRSSGSKQLENGPQSHSASLLTKYSPEVRLLNVLYEYAVSNLTSDPISI